MLNLKIFHRKFDLGLVGYSPGPKPPLYVELKEKKLSCDNKNGARQNKPKFHLQSDRHSFLDGPLRCDPSRSVAISRNCFLNGICRDLPRFAAICRDLPRFAAICRDLPRFTSRLDRQSSLVGGDSVRTMPFD